MYNYYILRCPKCGDYGDAGIWYYDWPQKDWIISPPNSTIDADTHFQYSCIECGCRGPIQGFGCSITEDQYNESIKAEKDCVYVRVPQDNSNAKYKTNKTNDQCYFCGGKTTYLSVRGIMKFCKKCRK